MKELTTLAPDSNEQFSITTIEYLKKINSFRGEDGQNPIRNNHFINRVEDEIDDLSVCKTFVNDKGAPPMRYYNLNEEQSLLVGMRESKVVRKKVLHLIKSMAAKLNIATLPSYQIEDSATRARIWADEQEASKKIIDEQALQLTTVAEVVKENAPKVVFANAVTGSSNSVLIRKFAKDISTDTWKIGQNKVFAWMRNEGYLMQSNEPYQNYIQQGLFEVITRTIGSGIDTFTTRTTKITGKGVVYFGKKITDYFN